MPYDSLVLLAEGRSLARDPLAAGDNLLSSARCMQPCRTSIANKGSVPQPTANHCVRRVSSVSLPLPSGAKEFDHPHTSVPLETLHRKLQDDAFQPRRCLVLFPARSFLRSPVSCFFASIHSDSSQPGGQDQQHIAILFSL